MDTSIYGSGATGSQGLPWNTAKAVEFLTSLALAGRPSGRLAVAALVPDVTGCEGHTFFLPDECAELFAWIEARQGKANLHFNLNEPVPREQQRGLAGRIRKSDIAWLRGCHVDCDPDPIIEAEAGGFARERERLHALALDWRNGPLPASAIIDSGGGYQGLWLFREPILANQANIVALENQNRGLARHFGGDNIPDVAHLLRIPWTYNLPKASKRERGRVATGSKGVML